MRVICDRCGNVVADGPPGRVCNAQLKVPGIGFKLCDGTLLVWKAGYIPGLSNERGNYDAQCEAIFSSLNAPRLVLLFVLAGPQGDGVSLCGEAGSVASISSILHNLADAIDIRLSQQVSS